LEQIVDDELIEVKDFDHHTPSKNQR